jgi:hypothetical protein
MGLIIVCFTNQFKIQNNKNVKNAKNRKNENNKKNVNYSSDKILDNFIKKIKFFVTRA